MADIEGLSMPCRAPMAAVVLRAVQEGEYASTREVTGMPRDYGNCGASCASAFWNWR